MLKETCTICVVAELRNGEKSYEHPFYVLANNEPQAERMVKQYLSEHKEESLLIFDELLGFHHRKGNYLLNSTLVLYDTASIEI